MNNEELDQLFKEKLGGSRPAYNPEAWKRMSALLDRQVRPVAAWYWRYSAAVLILGLVVYGLHWQFGGSEAAPSNLESPSFTIGQNKGAPFPQSAAPKKGAHLLRENPDLPEGQSISKSSRSLVNTTAPEKTGNTGKSKNQPVDPAKAAPQKDKRSNQYRSAVPPLENLDFVPSLVFRDLKPSRSLKQIPYRPLDSVLSNPDGAQESPLPSPGFTHQVWIAAGPSSGQRFTGQQDQTVRGFQAGANYQLGLDSAWSLSLGVQYRRIDKLQILTEDDTTIFTNQEREDILTERNFSTLELLSVPLKAHYQLNKRHRLSLGIYLNYALTQSMEMKQTTKTATSGSAVARDKITGMHDEFQRWNVGLTGAYHFLITPRFSTGLRLRYGLDDLTKPGAHRDIAAKNRLWQGDLVFAYRLF